MTYPLYMVQLKCNLMPARGLLGKKSRVVYRIHNRRVQVPVKDLTCVRYHIINLKFLREKIFTDFTDFCQTTKILTLKFLSSIAIQYNTSVIHEIFIHKTPKFINSQKYSPLKNLGYTVSCNTCRVSAIKNLRRLFRYNYLKRKLLLTIKQLSTLGISFSIYYTNIDSNSESSTQFLKASTIINCKESMR